MDEHPNSYLEGLVGQTAGGKFPIEGKRVCLGRDASQCQIVISAGVISKMHAAFEVDDGGQVTLVDHSNKQATFVNGEQIERRELRDGDRVGFGVGGLVAFIYHASEPAGDRQSGPRTFAERKVTRLVIPTGPLAEPELAHQPAAPANHEIRIVPSPPLPAAGGAMILHADLLPVIKLGRAPDNNFVLDAPSVSRYHAALSYVDGPYPLITDLGSTNGTFVNGEPVTEPCQLKPQDLVFLGGFLLNVDGRTITQHDLSASSITARHLSKDIAGKAILRDINLAIRPREFVGLMGPSGCGKSTLMDALNGLRPATSGQVCVNDIDLYSNFNAIRRSIGYVPQRDILHDSLTVERTLYYAARLRLPEGTAAEARAAIVDEVIDTVGLNEQRDVPFRQLSGGQQKRLSLAFELVTKPTFIFLDEPTSPLDPETTDNMMMLFRQLADEGRIVVMVTHKFERFHAMHQIALLTRGGRLAYFGPPAEALGYFSCKEPGEMYRLIGTRDPDELSASFLNSSQHERYVAGRIRQTERLSRTSGGGQFAAAIGSGGPERRLGLDQWLTLTRRYLEVKLNDRRNTILLLAQAPIVALVLVIIVRNSPVNDSKTLFISAIISFWFGANNAVREIVSESAIYVRERLVNLKIPSYVFSKFAVLAGIAFIQCLLFVGLVAGTGRLNGGDFFSLTLILYLTSLAGITTGLFLSGLVNSSEKAMSILPLILIPQLLLSGFMVSIDDIYYSSSGKPVTEMQYQHYQDTKSNPPKPSNPSSIPTTTPEIIGKHDGLGVASYAAAAIVARWTIDGLAHDVSINDQSARDGLATRMSLTGYQAVFDGKSEDDIETAYRNRVAFDCGVLALFSVLFLGLTMWALKRKDVL